MKFETINGRILNNWIVADYKTSFKKSTVPGIKCGIVRRWVYYTQKHVAYVTEAINPKNSWWTVSIYPIVSWEPFEHSGSSNRIRFARFIQLDEAKNYVENELEGIEQG